MTAEDWESKYREAWERFKVERIETLRLKDRMSHKQERYIAREQEYRKTIEQIEKDSDRDRWFTAAEASTYGLIDHVYSTAADAPGGSK